MVKFGLYLNQYTDDNNAFMNISEQIQLLEKVGFDGVFAGGRHVYKGGFLDTISALATLVFQSKKLDVGTDLAILPFYHPLKLAEILANFDRASRGHLIVGLGIGYRLEEFEAFGISIKTRTKRFEEGIRILDSLLKGEVITFKGKYYQVKNAFVRPLPFQTPRPPIYIGGYNEHGLQRAAQFGDGWVSNNHELGEFRGRIKIYKEKLKAVGKDPDSSKIIYNMKGFCSKTLDDAMRLFEKPLFAQYTKYSQWGLTTPELDLKKLADTRLAIGSPEDCIEKIAPFVEAGANYIVLRTQLEGITQKEVLSSIRLFGTKVLPYFRQ